MKIQNPFIKSSIVILGLVILSACGGGGGSCTPSSTVQITYKDSRVAGQNAWSGSDIVFPSLTKVKFLPVYNEVCGKKVSFFGTTKNSYGNTYSRYIGNGLEMSEDGIISGIPLKTGSHTYYIGIEVEGYKGYATTALEFRVDDFGIVYYKNNTNSITVKVGEDIEIDPAITDGRWESLFKDQPQYINGQTNSMRGSFLPKNANTKYSIENGSLPLGVLLDSSTGKIFGKPINSGYYYINIKMDALNSDGIQSAENGSLYINIEP